MQRIERLACWAARRLASSALARSRLRTSLAYRVYRAYRACRVCWACVLVASLLDAPPTRAAEDGVACSLRVGIRAREIQLADAKRSYWVAVGPGVPDSGPAPVVFVWHGWGGGAQSMLRLFDPERLWRDAIVVAAEGAPRRFPGLGSSSRSGWQLRSGEFEDRDLRFFDAILTYLQSTGCVDPQRVYSTGFSNGGYFSNLLACKRGDVLAAVAPVSGGGPQEKACDGPMPILITHGSSDEVVPYREGLQSLERWSVKNGCEGSPAAKLSACVDGSSCSVMTRMCSFSGGHQWPRGGAQRIVEFLKSKSRLTSK